MVTGFFPTKKQKAEKEMLLLLPIGKQQRVKNIESNAIVALRCLREKNPPLVPKSTFGSLKTFQEIPETATLSQNVCYHGRPIRGYSHMACGSG